MYPGAGRNFESGARGYIEVAWGRGTGMVMGHSAAPATLLEPASVTASVGSGLALSVPDSDSVS